jgi:hypothetical protein
MKRCRTCKYYNADACSNAKFVYLWEGNVKDVPSDGLGYWDFEGYDADFCVGPDFGCVHHDERPA